MRLRDAYAAHTDVAKQQIRKELAALLKARDLEVSDSYLNQVLLELRKNPVSEDISIVISGYFIGSRGLSITPDEARGCQSRKPRKRRLTPPPPKDARGSDSTAAD